MLHDTPPGSSAGRCRGGQAGAVADPLPARRLTDQEGQRLLRIAGRGAGQPVRAQGKQIRAWSARNKVELCFTPTYVSWSNPTEAQFGPLRLFVIPRSNHPNHAVFARKLQAYLRWRTPMPANPDVLAAQRRERARVRSERQRRWGQPAARAA